MCGAVSVERKAPGAAKGNAQGSGANITSCESILDLKDDLLELCLLYLDTHSLLQWRSVSRKTKRMFATVAHARRHLQQLLLELHHSKAHLKAFSAAAGGAMEQAQEFLEPPKSPTPRRLCRNIGHKGAAGHILGNTMESFHRAIELGVDVIEFDVVACSDGLLCHHDPVVEETGEWLANLTMDQARARLGHYHPSLEEMLKDPLLLSSGVHLYFDLKHTNIVRPTMRAIERAVSKLGWTASRIIVATFTHIELLEVNAFRNAIAELKGLRTAAILDAIPLTLGKDFEALECSAVSVGKTCAQPDFISDCHRRGLEIWAWTVNSKVMVDELMRLGVDGLCTDFPELVSAAKERQSNPSMPLTPVSQRKAEAALGSVYNVLGGARQRAVTAIDEARLFTQVVKRCGDAASYVAQAAPGEAEQLNVVLASAEGVAEEVLHPLVSSPQAKKWAKEVRQSGQGRELMAAVKSELSQPLRCQSPMLSFERRFLNELLIEEPPQLRESGMSLAVPLTAPAVGS